MTDHRYQFSWKVKKVNFNSFQVRRNLLKAREDVMKMFPDARVSSAYENVLNVKVITNIEFLSFLKRHW